MAIKELKDLVGQRFGNLIVLHRSPRAGRPYWLCECVCGNRPKARGSHLVAGKIKSCGCLQRQAQFRSFAPLPPPIFPVSVQNGHTEFKILKEIKRPVPVATPPVKVGMQEMERIKETQRPEEPIKYLNNAWSYK